MRRAPILVLKLLLLALAACVPTVDGVGPEPVIPGARVATAPFGEFTTFNRARREVGQQAYSVLAGLETVYAPFLDHELNDFLAQVPWPTMWQADLHTDVVKRAYPDYAHLPYAGKTGSVSAGGMYARFAMQVLAYARRRNPDWLKRIPRLAAHWAMAAGSRRYRSTVKWATPARILNLILVDELRKDPSTLASHFAREP